MNTNVQIIAELKAFLMEASQQKEKYCDHATAFTRKRKLSFSLAAAARLHFSL